MNNLSELHITFLSPIAYQLEALEHLIAQTYQGGIYFDTVLKAVPQDVFFDVLMIHENCLPKEAETLNQLEMAYDQRVLIMAETSEQRMAHYLDAGFHYILRHDFMQIELRQVIEAILKNKAQANTNMILNGILTSANNSIVITDRDGKIIYANRHSEKMTGYTYDEIVTYDTLPFMSGHHDREFYDQLWRTVESGEVWSGVFVNKNKRGELIYEDATITPLKNSDGYIERFLKISKDITREQMLNQSMERELNEAISVVQAFKPESFINTHLRFDFLTKAYNRIGGDLVIFREIQEGVYGFCLIDVMGHGFASSMIGLVISTLYKESMMYLSLNKTLEKVNQFMCRFNKNNQGLQNYLSGIFGRWDEVTGKLEIINAGHPDFLIKYKNGEITRRGSDMPLLGISEQMQYSAWSCNCEEVASVMLFTDGMTETIDEDLDLALELLKVLIEADEPWEQVSHYFQYLTVSEMIEDDVTLCLISSLKI